MKVAIISVFDTYLDRVYLLKQYYEHKNCEVTVIAANFAHIKKTYYQPDVDIIVPVKAYYKNMSLDRILSHMDFSKQVRKILEQYDFDCIHCLVPCNTLVKQMALYKRKHKVKLIFDIIDLWPETMPVSKFVWMFPFKIWKNYRDNYLKYGDIVLTECNLYCQYIHVGKTVYWARDQKPLYTDVDLKKDELQFCYLGSINSIIDIELIVEFLRNCTLWKPCTLHIIGEGESKERFIQEVINAGVNVIDHKQIYDQKLKQEIFDQCNYGLNMMRDSVVVGLTMKSLDYLCGGLPIINTIKGDTKDFCDDWNIGKNITYDNLDDVTKLVCDETIDQNMKQRKNCLSLYNTYFTSKAFFDKLDEVLKCIGF